MESSPATITRLLGELQVGRREALTELFPLIYDELRLLAHRQRQRWQGNPTLDTTALVHEVYLKLVDQARVNAASRAHFLAVAAKAMRHILCNYARDQSRKKRGGELQKVTFDDLYAMPNKLTFADSHAAAMLALDDALRQLHNEDQSLSEIVECRFFAGMSIEETAAALDLSPATVKRRWLLARSMLYRRIEGRPEVQ
jgi:RNA polymerase sigma factor (TIGR02999 family)